MVVFTLTLTAGGSLFAAQIASAVSIPYWDIQRSTSHKGWESLQNALGRRHILRDRQAFLLAQNIPKHPVHHAGDPLMPAALRQINGLADNRVIRNPIQIYDLIQTDAKQCSYPRLKLLYPFVDKLVQK